ncbi:MAG TPA: transaldolase [Deinococcales bacterium]|nr:transaldolase [Deinococcales bacterium]
MNPLKKLHDFGQSVYLDELSRGMIADGSLEKLITGDGIHGVTSNPAIFEKAISGSDDYAADIARLSADGLDTGDIYEELVIEDIGAAADLFRGQYDASSGVDGYVSLEVSPLLADDTEGTVAEALHLWERLDRPNVFIKVPGTAAGVPAIRQLTAAGVNVNVTLLFGIERYSEIALAYIQGLEDRLEAGHSIRGVESVASFFLSRIDVLIDPQLEDLAERGTVAAKELRGRIAIANAKAAWLAYRELFGGERFRRLTEAGARPQRLLWASTGTKNPDYSDVMYVEPLVGPDTINTMPPATLDAYRDHGEPADRLSEGTAEALEDLSALASLGIDLEQATEQLEREGVEKFVGPFNSLLEAIATRAG